MRVLVAGGGGYVGSVLVPQLVERGYQVDVVDLFWFGCHLPDGVGRHQKDVFDVSERDLEGYDAVIFLGGLSNEPMALHAPGMNFIANAAAPAYLAYAAKNAGVRRFVHAGSCLVYSYAVEELCTEDSPSGSDFAYGIAKLQGEQAVLQLAGEAFSVICFRQGTVSGYSPRMRLDLVVNAMFRSALQHGAITVNDPTIWRPVLSIQDAARAYIRAVEAQEQISGVFNVASGNYTVGEIADFVKSALDAVGVSARLDIQHAPALRSYKVSIERARNVLSFKPHDDVESIVAELWVNRERFADLDDPRYDNLRAFEALDEEARSRGPRLQSA